jgi:2-octaprenyl-6-methoxyphenol hydroxylase
MHYDILIVGGGLVGTSLALGLSHRLNPKLNIGLVDSALPTLAASQKQNLSIQDAHNLPADNRTIALSDISLKILQALSGFSFNHFKTWPIEKIHISKKGRFAISRLKASDIGLQALGYSVEMTALVKALYEQLNQTPCKLIAAQFKSANRIDKGWKVVLASENSMESVSTKLLIAADGDHSSLRKQLNIPVTLHDYDQSAMVTTVKTQKPLEGMAFERFIPHGSIAILPIGEKKAKLVWVAKTAVINALMLLKPAKKQELLSQNIGSRLGSLTLAEDCFVYPLKAQQVQSQVQENFVLVGNAAHVLHPIAAQGFNLSLRDIAVLVDTLAQASNYFDSIDVLQRYLKQRLPDQKRTAWFTHGLTYFSGRNLLPSCLMLNFLEYMPFAKKELIRFAMGSFTQLPRWIYEYEPKPKHSL